MIIGILLPANAYGDAITEFTNSPAINSSEAAVLIIDLATGRTVASHNEDKPLIPASIMKCITTAGLLEQSGPDKRYITEVGYSGEIRDGVLNGDLLIKGSGDPSLNSKYISDNNDICRETADALQRLGVHRITGSIKVDETVFSGPACPPSWQSADLPHSYGTGQHGLNFEDNSIGKKSISNPGEKFKYRMESVLRSYGISIDYLYSPDAERDNKGTVLLNHASVPYDEIMRSCMMRSDNQYAESMLRTIAVNKGEKGSTTEGARINTEYWKNKGMPMAGVRIVDGSGLSRENRVTANFMGGVLKKMSGNPYYASFFPLAGQEGTLKNFLVETPLEGYVAMKTGSMNGIQCYAGYKVDDNYAPTHVIVVIMNSMKSRGPARSAVADMLLNIFDKYKCNTVTER